MKFATIKNFTVVFHSRYPPNEDEWDEYLTACAADFTRNGFMRYLVVSDGGAPSAVQRMRLNENLAHWTRTNPDAIRTAVLTKSAFVRGVVTAINWFRPTLRAYSPDNLGDALTYLGVPPELRSDVEALIPKVRSELEAANAGTVLGGAGGGGGVGGGGVGGGGVGGGGIGGGIGGKTVK
jgi:hypothetical protein